MRVARLHGAGDLRVTDEPSRAAAGRVPGAGGGGRHLRLRPALVRGGRDRRRAARRAARDRPRVRGSGRGRSAAGRRVAVDPAIPCERCELCREGHPNLCPDVVFAGHGACDGGLRQYLSWPVHRLHPLPDVAGRRRRGDARAARGRDPCARSRPRRRGARVAIVGCGPIGLLLAQVCTAAGASVALAVDPLEHRRAAALRAGAEVAIAPDAIESWDGAEVDVAFEAAGTDDAVDLAMRAVRPGSARRAGRDPGRRPDELLGVGRAAQGRHARARPADEGGLPARAAARRGRRGRRAVARHAPVPARTRRGRRSRSRPRATG